MSITSRLFQKAVKVLRRGRNNRHAKAAPVPPAQRFSFLEPLEGRELMSVVSIATTNSATEGGPDGVIRITRDDTLGDLVVKFSATGGSGLGATRDFTLNDGVNNLTKTVVIPDGAAFVDINFVATDDTIAEATETITFKLQPGAGYTLHPDHSIRTATATITDNEPVVTVTATDAVAAESGTPATNGAVFTVTRTNGTTGDLTVSFTLKGTAKRGKDYLVSAGGNPITKTVVIPDGQASVDIAITPLEDLRYEPTEDVSITLKKGSGYTLGGANTAAAVINDNEPLIFVDPSASAPASFTIDTNNEFGADTYIINGIEANETHDAGPAFREFARDGFFLINQGVPLEVRNAEGVLNANSRKAYVSFDMSLFPFTNFSNAIFTLTLVDTEGASPNNTNFTFNVFGLNDDFVPATGIQNEDWNEDINYSDAPGNIADGGLVNVGDMFGGGPLGSFNIVGDGTIGQKVSISGQLLTDYLNNESTLDADGDNLVTFVIVRENVGDPNTDTIIHKFGSRDDPFGEADTTVIPQLTGVGEVVGLQIPENSVAAIRIFRAGTTTGNITVPFTARGVAKLGIDYTLEVNGTPITSSFVIPDGESFVDIQFLPIDDSIFEIPEGFEIVLGSTPNYVLDPRNQVISGQIIDDEAVVTISPIILGTEDTEAVEPDDGSPFTDNSGYRLTRTGPTNEPLTVRLKFSGTAINGKDYERQDEFVTFQPGESFIQIVIDPLADTIPEGTETIIVSILPDKAYGTAWVLSGSSSTTGSELGPDIVGANGIKQARQLAKDLGYAGPTLVPEETSTTITLANGNPPPGPDLIAAFFTLLNNTVDNDTNGGSFGTFTVRNQGNAATGAFNIGFVLVSSRDAADPNGIVFPLPLVTVQSIGAFGSVTVTISFADLSLLPAGDYFIGAIVDVNDFVLETFEDNNSSAPDSPFIRIVD